MALGFVGAALLFVSLSSVGPQTVHGTVTFAADSDLPSGSALDVTLEDVSRADAPAVVVASRRIAPPGRPPIAFTLDYDTARIIERGRYVIRAQIRDGDRLMFTSDVATPVITGGHPTTVAMTLRRVTTTGSGQPSTPAAGGESLTALAGSSWKAVELYGTPVPASLPAAREPHLVFGTDGRVSGADGCNRLTGAYTQNANGVTFGQMAGTRMICPNTEEIARRFAAALKGTAHWSVVAERLEFYGATGKPLAVFVRRAPSSAVRADDASVAPLTGTSWRLVKFQGGDDRLVVPDDPAKYTLEFAADGRLAARLDCNRGRGTWKATATGQLTLGPLALTRAKCPEGSLHDQVAKHWNAIRTFLLKDGHLFLALMADGGIYEFEPVTPAAR